MTSTIAIQKRVRELLKELPSEVTLVAAVKGRTVEEVRAAIEAGVRIIGHNYVQEAESMADALGDLAEWHMIGHLQRNKVKRAVEIFDRIETLDSIRLAQEIDKRCAAIGKQMVVLVEVNSGREANKTGVMPEDIEVFVRQLATFENLRVEGVMTMGPRFGDPEQARPYFRTTRASLERLSQLNLPNVAMRTLSMGMSNSYRIAIEEGANLVRIGTRLFGERPA
jgi:pyridoxal phosphate enzyme (YggS family)